MTPLQIEILLWYYARCEEFPSDAPAVLNAIEGFFHAYPLDTHTY